MFRTSYRAVLAAACAFAATTCVAYGRPIFPMLGPAPNVAPFAYPADVGFHAMSVSFTKSLIGDNGFLIANFARHYGIRTLFLPIEADDITNLLAGNPTTVANLEALFDTCTVYMVTGSDAWLGTPGIVPVDARLLAHQIGPMYPQFAGIVYDIEPQLIHSWYGDRQGTIDRYFTLLDTLLTGRNPSTFRTTYFTTISDYARQPNRSGGHSPSMLGAIEAYGAVSGTYLLMPGKSAPEQIGRSKPALQQMGKPFLAVASTSPYSRNLGYHGSTPAYLAANMSALAVGARAANPHFAAVSVSSWDDAYASLPSILPQPTPQPVPQPTGPLVPPTGTDYIGAYVAPDKTPPGPATIAAFEAQIGRKLAYDIHYQHWNGQFPGSDEKNDEANGRIPLISWHCGDTNAHIEAGVDDALIKARADALRTFGKPIFLRYEWEMNLTAKTKVRKPCYDPKTDLPTGFFSPQRFVGAWRRMHAIFKTEHANNVIFLWNPGGGGPDPAEYYPGDDVVDWVGLDTYDRDHLSFENTFVPYLDQLSQFHKPMAIVETGAPANDQGTYFATSERMLRVRYPLVRAFSYLDAQSTTNWTLVSAGIAGYKALANSRLMSARQPQ